MHRTIILKLIIITMSTNLSTQEATAQASQKGKMYFSNQPFSANHNNAMNEFKSSDFIYGRIESDKGPLKDAFTMSTIKTQHLYLLATYHIVRDDGREKFASRESYIKMTSGAENGTSLNFDILPAAEKAATIISILEDISAGQKAGFFDPFLNNSDYYWRNGAYQVDISIYLKSYNAWGQLDEIQNWPDITGTFTFHFNEKDVALQMKNLETANELVKENSLRMDKLPEYFSKPAKISDPELYSANILAILKRDLPSVNFIKAVIPPFDGQLKDIAKNDLDVILYRYVRPYVRVIYKENGKCYLGSVSLREDYLGGGKYGPLKFNKFWGSEGLFDCSLIK
jgi:hypothetical protein